MISTVPLTFKVTCFLARAFPDNAAVVFSCSFETDFVTCSINNYGDMKWRRNSVSVLIIWKVHKDQIGFSGFLIILCV